jgi:hypothetical protein
VRLTDEDKNEIWRAGNNGGWRGVYVTGAEKGLRKAMNICEDFAVERGGGPYKEIAAILVKRMERALRD